MQYLLAALAALIFAGVGKNKGSKKVTSGTAQLKANRAYRIELQYNSPLLQTQPQQVAQGLDNGLRMAGAYDVLVQPTIPLLISYSIIVPGDLPIVLNVPAEQTIAGYAGQYTFLSVQEIKQTRAAA